MSNNRTWSIRMHKTIGQSLFLLIMIHTDSAKKGRNTHEGRNVITWSERLVEFSTVFSGISRRILRLRSDINVPPPDPTSCLCTAGLATTANLRQVCLPIGTFPTKVGTYQQTETIDN